MTDSPYYSREELLAFGFESVGEPTWISRKASLYAIKGSLGHHVRVDDFCILKGHIRIGSYVHVAAYCSLSGVAGVVELGDCSSVGNRASIYSGSDDYKADSLASNLVPQELVSTLAGPVRLGRAALVGAHCVLLPGVQIGDAAAVGSQCVVNQSIEAGTMLVSATSRNLQVGTRDVARVLALAGQVALQAEAAGAR